MTIAHVVLAGLQGFLFGLCVYKSFRDDEAPWFFGPIVAVVVTNALLAIGGWYDVHSPTIGP